MASIDVGSAAIASGSNYGPLWTRINLTNPANATGVLDTVELYFVGANGTNVKVGTFYGTTTTKTLRDFEIIGTVNLGSKQTFSGLSFDVSTDDCIGIYYTDGSLTVTTSGGGGGIHKYGDQFGAGIVTYDWTASEKMSIYATGLTPVAPTVTTQAVTNIVIGGATLNGNITDDGRASISQHGFCWKAGSDPVNIAGADGYSELGAGAEGAYNQAKTGLTENAQYYCRAYGTNSEGTGYGSAQNWKTGGILQGEAIISVIPSLVFNGNYYTHGAVSISATSALGAFGGVVKQGEVTILSVVRVIAGWQVLGICSIQSVSSLSLDGDLLASGNSDISVIPSLSIIGEKTANGVVAFSVVSSVAATADKYRFASVTISSTSSLSALGVAYMAQIMGYTGTLTAGDVLIIDVDEQTVTLNGANATQYFTGVFPQLYSGTNELLWEDGGELPDLDFETKHSPRYL